MEPTVGNPRAALNGSREQLTAEPGKQDALTPDTGSAEPAGRTPSRMRAALGRVRPRRLARETAGSPAQVQRSQPGRLAQNIAGTTARLRRSQPGRAAGDGAGRTARLPQPQPGGAAGDGAGRTARLPRSQPGRVVRGITRGVESIWREHPLEATSITLMALAGLAYPFPFWAVDFAIWLIGAAIAVPSRLWDLRDKWSGLAGPVALVIVGTAITLSVGGTRTTMPGYVHEALAGSVYLIKVGSLAGAGYLVWRVRKGRRIPAVPPWRRQARR